MPRERQVRREGGPRPGRCSREAGSRESAGPACPPRIARPLAFASRGRDVPSNVPKLGKEPTAHETDGAYSIPDGQSIEGRAPSTSVRNLTIHRKVTRIGTDP